MSMNGFIYDPESGKCLAKIEENGEVFDVTKEESRLIGNVKNENIYDLDGNLVGHLDSILHSNNEPIPDTFKNLISYFQSKT